VIQDCIERIRLLEANKSIDISVIKKYVNRVVDLKVKQADTNFMKTSRLNTKCLLTNKTKKKRKAKSLNKDLLKHSIIHETSKVDLNKFEVDNKPNSSF